MLGFSAGEPTIKSFFGQVNSTFRMDDVKCRGNETSLLDCPHKTKDDCGASEGAGVVCSNGRSQILCLYDAKVFLARQFSSSSSLILISIRSWIFFWRLPIFLFWVSLVSLQRHQFTSIVIWILNFKVQLLTHHGAVGVLGAIAVKPVLTKIRMLGWGNFWILFGIIFFFNSGQNHEPKPWREVP